MGAVLMMCCLVPFQFIIGKCMSANMDKISVSGWEIMEKREKGNVTVQTPGNYNISLLNLLSSPDSLGRTTETHQRSVKMH